MNIIKTIYHAIPLIIWELLFIILMILGFSIIAIICAFIGSKIDNIKNKNVIERK